MRKAIIFFWLSSFSSLTRAESLDALSFGWQFFWSDKHLLNLDSITHPAIHQPLALEIAAKSKSYAVRRSTTGNCLKGVRLALFSALRNFTSIDEALMMGLHHLPTDSGEDSMSFSPGRSAHNFFIWAQENPRTLCDLLGLEAVKPFEKLVYQPGMILAYGRGSCGFSNRYGHIEVVTNAFKQEVCSDHCSPLKQDCAPDMVLVPSTSCLKKA